MTDRPTDDDSFETAGWLMIIIAAALLAGVLLIAFLGWSA